MKKREVMVMANEYGKCRNCGCDIFKEDGIWMHSQCDIDDEQADIRNGDCTCGCKKPVKAPVITFEAKDLIKGSSENIKKIEIDIEEIDKRLAECEKKYKHLTEVREGLLDDIKLMRDILREIKQ